ncbi:MAG TPA: DUF883 family protein [Burkholderiaceae bacterium]|nr:DUF883 family protein [Burkholderiaceae bacterium]
MADVKVVLDDVDNLLRQAAAASGQQAAELRERAAESLHRAKLRLQEAQAAVGETTRAAARATDDWVHQHPWSAIGIGAGIGFLIGLLVARR